MTGAEKQKTSILEDKMLNAQQNRKKLTNSQVSIHTCISSSPSQILVLPTIKNQAIQFQRYAICVYDLIFLTSLSFSFLISASYFRGVYIQAVNQNVHNSIKAFGKYRNHLMKQTASEILQNCKAFITILEQKSSLQIRMWTTQKLHFAIRRLSTALFLLVLGQRVKKIIKNLQRLQNILLHHQNMQFGEGQKRREDGEDKNKSNSREERREKRRCAEGG